MLTEVALQPRDARTLAFRLQTTVQSIEEAGRQLIEAGLLDIDAASEPPVYIAKPGVTARQLDHGTSLHIRLPGGEEFQLDLNEPQ
jgi:hypothetical protein